MAETTGQPDPKVDLSQLSHPQPATRQRWQIPPGALELARATLAKAKRQKRQKSAENGSDAQP
jgi:hypothetical protein